MGISRGIEGPEDDLALVADAIAIGIAKVVEIWDRKGDHAVLVGQQADRDIESIGKSDFGFERTVVIFVFEHDDGIAEALVVLGGEWVEDALGQPQSAFGIEG